MTAPVGPSAGARLRYVAGMENAQPHIMVVDDDREIRDLLGKFLEKQSFRVTVARDAREARKLWPLGRYHLVVLDLMMPANPGSTSPAGCAASRRSRSSC
jgi:DNA-binding response OmpR family regulator